MKYRFYTFCGIAVILCIIAAVIIRVSYVPNGTGVSDYSYGSIYNGSSKDLLSGESSRLMEVKASSADDLFNKADIVVRCRFTGQREINPEGFYSTVNIKIVYKGSQGLTGTDIIITEVINSFSDLKSLNVPNGLLPLKENHEYILLLKKTEVSKYRSESDIINKEYYLLGSSPFSVYRIDGYQTKPVENISNPTLNTLKNFDFAVSNQEVIDKHIAFRKQIFTKLQIN